MIEDLDTDYYKWKEYQRVNKDTSVVNFDSNESRSIHVSTLDFSVDDKLKVRRPSFKHFKTDFEVITKKPQNFTHAPLFKATTTLF